MKATFVELPPFERTRKDDMDDEAYRLLQLELLNNPIAGDVMEGTGGLRKLRQADLGRGKGKRGGLQPLIDATNQVMSRLQHLLENQKRFVRDAAHQLRTPLTVLKVQVQSALRGDLPATAALQEIAATVDRAALLANQMLSLAKVEQVRQQADFWAIDWDTVVRDVALDLSPLIAQKDLDFELTTTPCRVHGHEWMLRELVRNLLHNAIHHCPAQGALSIHLSTVGDRAVLMLQDSGPGIADDLRLRLFQPYASGHAHSGTGLGLTIVREIVAAMGGSIQLNNRWRAGVIVGLDAMVNVSTCAADPESGVSVGPR